jgi:hypothetical protein
MLACLQMPACCRFMRLFDMFMRVFTFFPTSKETHVELFLKFSELDYLILFKRLLQASTETKGEKRPNSNSNSN